MALFDNCVVVLELKNLPFKEKTRLKMSITENGGVVSYVVNKQCTLIVTTSVSSLSPSRVRSVKKYQTPVVGVEYVSRCLENGVLLPVEEFCLDPDPSISIESVLTVTSHSAAELRSEVQTRTQDERAGNRKRGGTFLGKFRVYTENDKDIPEYPANFHVAKYSIYEKVNCTTWSVVELQSSKGAGGQQEYRVVRYRREDSPAKSAAVPDKQMFLRTSEEAVDAYHCLCKQLEDNGFTLWTTLPPEALDLGSANLHQLLLEKRLSCSSISQEVGVFVELLWAEALGCLDNVLKVPITSLSLNDVSRAEGLLLQVQKRLREKHGEEPDTEVSSLMEEIYTLLPHKTDMSRVPVQTKLISSQLDLCQLIRDMLNVSEAMLRSSTSSCLGKYRALRCSIERVPPGIELRSATNLLQDRRVRIIHVLKVTRGVEQQMFREELGNVKPLLHSSSPSSFVGILSRGLLLPRVGVEHHGIERTDIGNLGGGIYFSNTMSASLKYSSPSENDGSRLLLVCDVALGNCKDLKTRDCSLTQAPDGFHSVHGVRQTLNKATDFTDDEYVVYSPEQVRLNYVVQFRLEGDNCKDFLPNIDTSATELPLPVFPSDVLSGGEEEEGVGNSKNPLEGVTAGLLDSSGQPLPLQAVHIRARLMDLLSQVIIFQTYTNQSTVPIEAKYVFPLDDSAAVCGFEAFINGKHVVGQVKEKQQARKEYKQAIEKGHGAYLMDQDAPDVFTISVGNLPAGATVLIKVTFVTELVVTDGIIYFSLPGSVAPWQQSSALNQRTQVTLEKVCVTNLDSQGEFSLDMSIEMPNKIIDLHCVSHKVKIKRTDCKAVVRTCPGESLGPDGFLLSFSLAQIHLPRMWVEKHPDKDSQACMLVFYPHFEPRSSSGSCEVILLLDSSESMRGEALQNGRTIALQLLNSLKQHSVGVNVISFGTDQEEALISAQPVAKAHETARKFIMSSPPVGGSTELWGPLRCLSLLPPSQGVRNLLLLSDGHVQNQALTLQLVREHSQHTRLFTCGLSPTANRHMLRTLAQAGGGTYEFFDTKTKHTWREKVASQVKHMMSPGCSSVSVKWQQFNPRAPLPVQAPSQLHALFSDYQSLIYGFVPHCTQASLLGDVNGQDIETMVSTTELQKTRGTFLHKLTARAVIRDYEDGSLHINEAEHEGKKAELKSFIIELSKEFSILSQYTSFVAIEKRDSEQPAVGFTDVPKLISDEDVDFLPYLSWQEDVRVERKMEEQVEEELSLFNDQYDEESYYEPMAQDMDFGSSSDDYENDSGDYEEISHYHCMPQRSRRAAPCGSRRAAPRRSCAINYISPPRPHSPYVAPPPPPPPPQARSRFMALCFQPESRYVPPPPQPQSNCVAPPLQPQSFSVAPPLQPQSLSVAPPLQPQSLSVAPPLQPQSLSVAPPLQPQSLSVAPPLQPQSLSDILPTSHVTDEIVRSYKSRERMGRISILFAEEEQMDTRRHTVEDQMDTRRHTIEDQMDTRRHTIEDQMDTRRHTIEDQMDTRRHTIEDQMDTRRHTEEVQMDTRRHTEEIQMGTRRDTEEIQMDTRGHSEEDTVKKTRMVPARCLLKSFAARGPVVYSTSTSRVLGTSLEGLKWPEIYARQHSVRMAAFNSRSEASDVSHLVAPGGLFGSSSAVAHASRRAKPKSVMGLVSPAHLLAVLSTCPEGAASTFRKRVFWENTLDEVKWPEIFALQHSGGYWECSASLGSLIGVDVENFANVFLKKKGISSLGVRAHADILRLVASLLVLQLLRVKRMEVGKQLLSLFRLDLDHTSPQPRDDHWVAVKRAVDWVCWADREYPCVCSRLEFGWDWESSTRQLLGVDPPHPLLVPWTTGRVKV